MVVTFHPLVQSLNAQDWARWVQGVRNLFWSLHVAEAQVFGPCSLNFQGNLQEPWSKVEQLRFEPAQWYEMLDVTSNDLTNCAIMPTLIEQVISYLFFIPSCPLLPVFFFYIYIKDLFVYLTGRVRETAIQRETRETEKWVTPQISPTVVTGPAWCRESGTTLLSQHAGGWDLSAWAFFPCFSGTLIGCWIRNGAIGIEIRTHIGYWHHR